MPTRKTPSPSAGDQADQNALVGYQTAITLWTYEGSQNWARFNMTLVANSIIMVMLGLALTGGQSAVVAALILSAVGMVVCAAWYLITRRGFDYQKYYIESAREIEETYLSNTIKTVSRGAIFADSQPVLFNLGGKTESLQMSSVAGILNTETTALVVIGVFGALYILAMLVTVFQMARGLFYY